MERRNEITYLPSTYLKFWWYWKRLNTNDKLDTLFLIIATISITYKILDKIKQERQAK